MLKKFFASWEHSVSKIGEHSKAERKFIWNSLPIKNIQIIFFLVQMSCKLFSKTNWICKFVVMWTVTSVFTSCYFYMENKMISESKVYRRIRRNISVKALSIPFLAINDAQKLAYNYAQILNKMYLGHRMNQMSQVLVYRGNLKGGKRKSIKSGFKVIELGEGKPPAYNWYHSLDALEIKKRYN